MRRKGDSSNFKCGTTVFARWTCLSISETADLPGFFRKIQSGVCRVHKHFLAHRLRKEMCLLGSGIEKENQTNVLIILQIKSRAAEVNYVPISLT